MPSTQHSLRTVRCGISLVALASPKPDATRFMYAHPEFPMIRSRDLARPAFAMATVLVGSVLIASIAMPDALGAQQSSTRQATSRLPERAVRRDIPMTNAIRRA